METVFQPSSSSPRHNLLDGKSDSDLLDQLLAGDEWFEIPDCSDTLQSNTLTPLSPFSSLSFSPLFEVNDGKFYSNLSEAGTQAEIEVSDESMTSFPCETSVIDRGAKRKQSISSAMISQVDYPPMNTKSPSPELPANWCIQPRDPSFPVIDRFNQALAYIHKDSNALVQIWVPVKRGDKLILTTYGQPFALDHTCEELASYREVSKNYQFSAEEDSSEALGLPGRVYLGRLPEWTPDVRYFNIHEYPRVLYAKKFGVRGTIALPVFERFGYQCLGVIEVVMTTHKITYSFELENICNALRAVELRSSGDLTIPRMKVSTDAYQVTLYEILEVLKGVCKLHMLPLAQTWVPCIQHGKQGTRHSDDNYRNCISTADEAFYVNDPSVLAFHEACSEHHLLRGQGVAGKAFTTNQPCYLSDITLSCKTEYPLSHHARMFSLKGAVAIRLRSIQTGTADFVLEFFLPTSCTDIEDQKLTLDSLSSSIQNLSQTLRVITAKELDDEAISEVNGMKLNSKCMRWLNYNEKNSGGKHTRVAFEEGGLLSSTPPVTPEKELSSNAKLKATEDLVMTNQIDKSKDVIPSENTFSKFKKPRHNLFVEAGEKIDSFADVGGAHVTTKETERQRKKTEKTISLQVLQKYFAGSLKDAAKSIGVCPTTLKRICRQHGITRWPSRKIKKVDHSLKKLQVVIDSVHGANKVINLISLYKDFSVTSSSDNNLSAVVTPSLPEIYNNARSAGRLEEDELAHHPSSSSQSASKCSQMSSSGFSSSSGEKQCSATELPVKQEIMEEQLNYFHQSVSGHQESIVSHEMAQKCVMASQDCTSNRNLSSLGNNTSKWISVKAIYDSEKVRLRLNPSWSFHDLKDEILRRFNLSDTSLMNLKYFDDDSEWVLITCDADLGECLHVYESTGARTIRILVEPSASAHTRGSLGHIG